MHVRSPCCRWHLMSGRERVPGRAIPLQCSDSQPFARRRLLSVPRHSLWQRICFERASATPPRPGAARRGTARSLGAVIVSRHFKRFAPHCSGGERTGWGGGWTRGWTPVIIICFSDCSGSATGNAVGGAAPEGIRLSSIYLLLPLRHRDKARAQGVSRDWSD